MKKNLLYLAVLIHAVIQPAFAFDIEGIPTDNRIKILTYSSTDIYTIPTKYGYQTSIVFSSGEQVNTISVGDRALWQIIPNANRLFIRPLADGIETNMTVITNSREYHFDIKSVEGKEHNNIYVAQFRYPDYMNNNDMSLNDLEVPIELVPSSSLEPMPSIQAQPQPPIARSAPVAVPPLDTQRVQGLNMMYSYTGPDNIAPKQVYDDGRFTYILYDTMPSPAPRPFIVTASGEEVLGNHRAAGNEIVLFTVAHRFVLKSDNADITVYNESLKVNP